MRSFTPCAPAEAGGQPRGARTEALDPQWLRTWAPAFAGAMTRVLILMARLWQFGPSRLLPPSCRFTPSCSAYAIQAWRDHGPLAGSWLALRRIVRCNPWGGCGHDPVPPSKDRRPCPNSAI